MLENLTKQRLVEGDSVIGCFVRSRDPDFAEFVANGPWDFLVFDAEHGSVSPTDVANLARACERRRVTPIVRVASHDSGMVLRCLDAGAAGLHFPWISTREEARSAVSTARYWPLGVRGLAGNRSTDYEVSSEATENANEATLVVAQVETREAVDNIESLCEVEGINVLFVGPSDLSLSYGVPGDLDHPLVSEAIQRVAKAVSHSDKVLGLFAGTPEAASRGLEIGVRYLTTGIEALLGLSMVSFVKEVRSKEGRR